MAHKRRWRAVRLSEMLGVTSPMGTDNPANARLIVRPVLFEVGSAVKIFPLCPGADYGDNRSMPLWGNSLGKFGTPDCYARVLVQGLSIFRCRQRNGQRLLPHSVLYGDGPDQRLCKC